MTYIDDLKYEQFVEDMDSHFSRVRISNFDLFHHQCCGGSLRDFHRHSKTIFDSDFEDYEDRGCNQVISSAVRSERDDIHFERDLPKTYIKSNIEKDSILNSLFIKKRKKKRTIDDCKRLMF